MFPITIILAVIAHPIADRIPIIINSSFKLSPKAKVCGMKRVEVEKQNLTRT